MVRTILAGVNWGVDPLPPEQPGAAAGAQINLLDPQSGHYYHVPFDSPSLADLVGKLAIHLTQEQRAALAPNFTSGIHLPGRDFNPGGQG